MKQKKIYWGKPFWQTMHYVALKYPSNPTETDKMTYINFYNILGDVLPCEPCRKHYKKMLQDYPMDDTVLKDKDSVFAWTVFLHNQVNKRINKKIYTVEEAKRLYTHEENDNKKRNLWIISIVLILILISAYIIKQRCKR